jgi:predicted regulator of Ras-like GTPase activity (Roadblock/LC7/MglB family)
MSRYAELLRDTVTKVKYCQRVVICSPDGLVVEAFPKIESDLNEALAASATSILGVTSSVSERAGKKGNDYVLIKNLDSFLLVLFVGDISLFLIASIEVNLGMLLHVGKNLRKEILELETKTEPIKPSEEIIEEVAQEAVDNLVIQAVDEDARENDTGEKITTTHIVENEDITTTHITETEITNDARTETEDIQEPQDDEVAEAEEIKEVEFESTPEETLPDETQELFAESERSKTETKYIRPGDDAFQYPKENDNIEETVSENIEVDTNENTDSIKFHYELEDDTSSNIDEDSSDETSIFEQKIEEDDKKEDESYHSFISWRERLEKERDAKESEEDSDGDLIDND